MKANLPRMKACQANGSRRSEALIKLVAEHSPLEVPKRLVTSAATPRRNS
jgi:hypothetical protein